MKKREFRKRDLDFLFFFVQTKVIALFLHERIMNRTTAAKTAI